jgi:N-acetylglutamate synthase-like GNAT family acetyltransferase
MIRNASENDFNDIYNVINDAAIAYKGVIPNDRWHEPYMRKQELKTQIEDGVRFYCYIDNNKIVGVMGIQDKGDVNLIRHAYVATKDRKKGIGTELLHKLLKTFEKPVLIGTWKAAHWAISFYEKHGFFVVSEEEKNILLRKYWSIPDRQVETSVVLADTKFKDIKNHKQLLEVDLL